MDLPPPAPRPFQTDPHAVLDAHARALASAFREALAEAYMDSREPFERLRKEAARSGPAAAARSMRDGPERFGTLRGDGEAAARRAAVLGARAYRARIARDDPALGAQVLSEAFVEAARAAGADAGRLWEAWDTLADAYGPDAAASLLARRPREVLGPAVDARAAASLAELAAAGHRLMAGRGGEANAGAVTPALPRSVAEEADAASPLAPRDQERLVAVSDGYRQRLARAYAEPLLAEARLHVRIRAEGPAAMLAAELYPASLGALRDDLPRGHRAATAEARNALAYAREAYRLQLDRPVRAPEAPEPATSPAPGEPPATSFPTRGRPPSQSATLPAGRGGTSAAGDAARASGNPTVPAPGSRPLRSQVDRTVDAHDALEAARGHATTARTLREERASAAAVLARLRADDRAVRVAERDLRSVVVRVYADPGAAMERWRALVRSESDIGSAVRRVTDRPTVLGRLRREPRPGLAGRLGLTTDHPAASAALRVAAVAGEFARAEAHRAEPVEWRSPEGVLVRDRMAVREEATRVLRDRQEGIARADQRLAEIGGVGGAEQAVRRSLDRLSPAEAGEAAARIAARVGRSVMDVTAMLARVGMRGAQVARTLGEGPAGP